jgi:hypothetical protein
MTLFVRSGGVYQPVKKDGLTDRWQGAYYRQRELFVRNGGVYKSVYRMDGPPPPPSSVTVTARNGGYLTVNWTWADNPENDYLGMAIQEFGEVDRLISGYPDTSQLRGDYAHGQPIYLQAASVDYAFNYSEWVGVTAAGAGGDPPPTYEPPPTGGGGEVAINVLPQPAVFTNMDWLTSGSWHVVWNDPANPYGDISEMQVHTRLHDGGAWQMFGSYPWTGQAGREVWVPGFAWDAVHDILIRTVNAAGYADTNVGSNWTSPQPGTEKNIGPDEGNSFGFAAGAWRDDGTVRQGAFSPTPWGLHVGAFFYGTKLWEAGHGYQPTSGEIFMMRSGSEGFTGPVFFSGHAYTVNSRGWPNYGGQPGWVSQSQFAGSGASGWEPLPLQMLQGISSGYTRGIGIFTDNPAQGNYKVFLGPAHNGYAGAVKLRW